MPDEIASVSSLSSLGPRNYRQTRCPAIVAARFSRAFFAFSLGAIHDKLVGSTSMITAVSGISRFAQNSMHPLSALVRFDRFAAFKRN